MITNTICPICKSKFIYQLTNKIRSELSHLIMICDDCNHIFPCKNFSYDEIKIINSNYYSKAQVKSLEDNLLEFNKYKTEEKNLRHKEYVPTEVKNMINRNHSVLVVGGGECYSNELLFNYLETVDSSRFKIKNLTSIKKINKHNCCMFEDYNTDKKFDFIIMPGILIYFSDPLLVFEKVYNLLNNNGKLLIDTIIYLDQIELNDETLKRIFMLQASQYFTDKSIKFALQKSNFKNIRSLKEKRNYFIAERLN